MLISKFKLYPVLPNELGKQSHMREHGLQRYVD